MNLSFKWKNEQSNKMFQFVLQYCKVDNKTRSPQNKQF